MERSAPLPPDRSRALLTVPNVLSLLRLASVPVFVWLFLTDREEAAVIIYGIGAWTDFFDGWIARRLNQVSELGKLLDPLADRVFIIALAAVLVADDAFPWWLAAVVIGRDVIVLALYPLLRRVGIGVIPVNFVGKTATASLLFGLTWLALAETGLVGANVGDEIGIAFSVVGAILYWFAGFLYAGEAYRRYTALREGSS